MNIKFLDFQKQYAQIKNEVDLSLIHIFDSIGYNYEVIIVVDGFDDKTHEKAKKCASRKVKVVGYKLNQGKGLSLIHI